MNRSEIQDIQLSRKFRIYAGKNTGLLVFAGTVRCIALVKETGVNAGSTARSPPTVRPNGVLPGVMSRGADLPAVHFYPGY